MEGDEGIYCWACGREISGDPRTFYTEEGKRAYVHSPFMGILAHPPVGRGCYAKAKQEVALFDENPMEVAEAEARKGILY